MQFRFLTLSLPTIFLLLSSTPCFTCQQVDTTTRATGRATDREILNVFPDSTVSAQNKFETTIQSKYSPSSSIWAEGLNEEAVFQAELTHREDETNSFSLRMGRGGQIYSLRGPFGESVPPSWRAEAQDRSPWNDEVWQFVAVCKRYNDLRNLRAGKNKSEEAIKQFTELPYANLYFVHNSGAYIPNSTEINSLYCPLLAVSQTKDGYQMLNWGLVPQIKTIHRSPILYYTNVRDAGSGIIEMTWVVHNFSVRDDLVFDHLNAPWGGTRVSSLPFKYATDSKGELVPRSELLNEFRVTDVRKTSGWDISCASEAGDSPSLALIYGRDKNLEKEKERRKSGEPWCQTKNSLYRSWRAGNPSYQTTWSDWATRPENSFRNYDVCEIIPKLRLTPGNSIWFRSYLVVGNKDRVIKQAKSLVDQVDYGLLEFDPDSTARLKVFNQDKRLVTQIGSNEPETLIATVQKDAARFAKESFQLFAKPVKGTQPLFLITNTITQQPVLTTDPYLFVKQEKLDVTVPELHPDHDYYSSVVGYSLDENRSDWQSLVGFGYKEKPKSGNWKQLSSLLDPNLFPAATQFHLDLWVQVE